MSMVFIPELDNQAGQRSYKVGELKMICAIYRSKRKVDTYVYVVKQEDEANNLDVVPKAIHEGMGELSFVMELDLESRDSLARVDIDAVKESLTEKGLYIQMPPSQAEMAAMDDKMSRL